MLESSEANIFVSQQVASSRLFFLDDGGDQDFGVVFGGYENCAADYRIDRQDFPWFCLEFVGRGVGSLRLGGRNEVLGPGSFFLYGPGVEHQIESSTGSPLGKYFVGFKGGRAEEFLEQYEMRPGFSSRCPKNEPIRLAFDSLLARGVRKTPLAHPLCAVILRQILLMCRDDACDVESSEGLAFATFSRVRDFIGANFLKLKTLGEIADACSVDAPYLCRLFARFHGESGYQFLTRLRMEHAAEILLERDATVQEVAAEMGFKDAFHFSRVFKSVHHAPPSRFRRSFQSRRSL